MSSELKKKNQKIMDDVAFILARPYPKGSEIFSRTESKLWFIAVEQIESRLLLANAMLDGRWMSGPKQISFNRDYSVNSGDTGKPRSVMKTSDVEKVRILVEQFISNVSSSPAGGDVLFPFREVMEKLTRFKAHLSEDPLLRTLFHKVSDSFRDKTPSKMPIIKGISNKQNLRLWYKYHGYYRVLIKVVELENDYLSESLKFNQDWIYESEDLVIMLFAYSIFSGQASTGVPKILTHSEKLLIDYPSIKTIHNAMKAFLV